DTPASSRGQSGSGDPALPPVPTAGGGGSAVTGRRAPWEDPEPGEPGAAPGLSPAELTILRRQVAAAVVRIAESSASRGSLPAGLVRWAEATLAPPRVPWQAALRAAVRAALRTAPGGEDYSYRRPNRRAAAYEPFVPPALRRPVPEVAALVDTSGSIADCDLARATAELVALVRALGGEGVYVVACDAAVQAEGLVRREADVRPLLRGGGGTDLRVGLAHLARRRPRPQVVVMFTDCHTPWPEQPPAWTRVIVARIGAAGQAPPWATVVDLELEEES
ncbi:MAG: VWA-like domain-containing protein, partial [Dehalococcoidia bacterium]|nr:VWA-like domain-containing protein [Dehalococcoidia bacterium]